MPELERLNFFPRSTAFVEGNYSYMTEKIKSKNEDTSGSTIREYTNAAGLRAGVHLNEKIIGGGFFTYENSIESGLRYGKDDLGRSSSVGFTNPGVFALWRIREQEKDKGIVDVYSFFRPYTGSRRIGEDDSNRKSGRYIFHTRLSHGLHEDDWEFRTSLSFTVNGEGTENNLLEREKSWLSGFNQYQFFFEAQYHVTDATWLLGGAGFTYTDNENITNSQTKITREVQSGTASIFDFGLKRLLRDDYLVKLIYSLSRSDYFVSAVDNNFDGDRKRQTFTFSLIKSF